MIAKGLHLFGNLATDADVDQGDGIVKDESVLAKALKVRSASGRNASLSCNMQSLIKKNRLYVTDTLREHVNALHRLTLFAKIVSLLVIALELADISM